MLDRTKTHIAACQEEPDEYKLTFHKIALCPEIEDPYTNGASPDYSGCVNILNEENIDASFQILYLPGGILIFVCFCTFIFHNMNLKNI